MFKHEKIILNNKALQMNNYTFQWIFKKNVMLQ